MESKLKSLEDRYNLLTENISNLQNNLNTPEIEALSAENSKLAYQLKMLNSAIAQCRAKPEKAPLNLSTFVPVIDSLKSTFSQAIKSAFPDLQNVPVEIAQVSFKMAKFGDYQCNSPLSMMKTLKSQGISMSPKSVAEKITSNLPKSELIESVNIANAGFINIVLNKKFAENVLQDFIKNGLPNLKNDEKVVLVDFSSPNIAKQMHVGHLRSTIIGDSICRLLEFLGCKVIRTNHIGDWGTQFGMLIAHLQDEFPNFATKSPDIGDLQSFYKQSKLRFDEDEVFKKRAYECVVKLQSGDTDYVNAWKLICDESRKEFSKIYNRLDVKITEKGESFYQSRMIDVVKFLEGKNLLEDDNGRKIMWPQNKSGIPLTVVKSDGGFTYDTSDMAAIKYRLEEEKVNEIIYVTDGGQATHFATIFSCAEIAGILNRSIHSVYHVPFGVVLGDDGKKFKTRSGETVKLLDLLDEGVKRSMAKLIEKGRDKILTDVELKKAQESVAYSCIKYADLSHNRINEYVFSFDRMLDDRGNTAVYLLYTFARIRAISRNCGISNIHELSQSENISIVHENEWKLSKTLLKLPDILLKCVSEYYLHFLCEYCYDICVSFAEFYDTCYCIEKNPKGEIVKINKSRILLCEVTALVLEQCYKILGLQPLEKI